MSALESCCCKISYSFISYSPFRVIGFLRCNDSGTVHRNTIHCLKGTFLFANAGAGVFETWLSVRPSIGLGGDAQTLSAYRAEYNPRKQSIGAAVWSVVFLCNLRKQLPKKNICLGFCTTTSQHRMTPLWISYSGIQCLGISTILKKTCVYSSTLRYIMTPVQTGCYTVQRKIPFAPTADCDYRFQ